MIYKLKEVRLPDGEVMRTHTLEPPFATIGRDSTCTIIIPQKGISKVHAMLHYENNHWIIRDVTYTRVYLNRHPLMRKEFHILNNFDQITLTTRPSIKFVVERQEDTCPENGAQSNASTSGSTIDEMMREAREGAARFKAEVKARLQARNTQLSEQTKRKATDDGNASSAKSIKMAAENSVKRCLQYSTTEPLPGPSSANDQEEITKESAADNKSAADHQNRQAASNEDLLTNELACAVCTELIVEAATLTCGHSFCNYCIKKWLAKEHKCPLCRENFCGTPAKSLIIDNTIKKLLSSARKELQEGYEITKKERKAQELASNQSSPPRRMSLQDYLDSDEPIPPLSERLRSYGYNVPVARNPPPPSSIGFRVSDVSDPPHNPDLADNANQFCLLCRTHGHREEDCPTRNI